MPVRSDHGYSVKRSNEVLRGVSIYSGDDRARSSSNYHVVRIGMKVGASVEWLATWDQSKQAMREGEPLSILPAGRQGMRLQEDSVIVAELTTVGFPASIRGSSVDLDLTLTGGSTGGRRPLISFGGGSPAVQAVADAVNTSGVAEKVARIPLDDVRQVEEGVFGGRLQRDSATQISIQQYAGNWIEVNGEAVSIGSAGLILTTADGLLSSSGGVTNTAPSTSTLYYVYVSADGDLRLSTAAPVRYRGVYYFGTSGVAVRWRFVGWVRTNGSTQFVDTTTDRLVVNYYHRRPASVFLCPAYQDDDTIDSFTETSTTWVAANGGTGATGSYIASGEDAIHVHAFSLCSNSGANVTRIGIGDNSATSASVAAVNIAAAASAISCAYATVPATGYRTLSLLTSVSAGTGTYNADAARDGSTADPAMTALYATLLV